MAQVSRPSHNPLADRVVSPGSVYSTILIVTVIGRCAPTERVDVLGDVDCGDSPYRSAIAHDHYIGVDRRFPTPGTGLVLGDVAQLPLRDDVAGGLLCTEVVEHVPDERLLMAELARVARPGSRLLLSSPFVHGLHEQPYDFRRLTSVGLATSLESAGWQVDSLCPVGGAVVVAVDGMVRWFDSAWRRVCRRLVGRESSVFRLLTAPSAALQRCLAALTLARENNLDPIDPMAPSPRLTLGYVVVATRRGDSFS